MALAAAGCGDDNGSPRPDGRKVFASAGCGGCHTLAAAGARGSFGPNFDTSEKLTLAQIERTVAGGGGGMPSFRDRLSPAEIRAVARFLYGATHSGARKTSR
jgi:mono/diheme cytochrome c family protein